MKENIPRHIVIIKDISTGIEKNQECLELYINHIALTSCLSLQDSKTSIILDATKYIEELRQRVERINQHVAMAQNSTCQNSYPVVIKVRLNFIFYIVLLLKSTMSSSCSCSDFFSCIKQ